MKKMFLTLLCCASTATADDVMVFKNGATFNHKLHQSTRVGVCSVCHENGTNGKIPGFGKEWAHKNCIECHDLFNEGPKECAGCHK